MAETVRLVYDPIRTPAPYAVHPRGRMVVQLAQRTVRITCPDGETVEVPLSDVPSFTSMNPRDGSGRRLPLRLNQPVLAKVARAAVVDVTWQS